MSYLKNLVKKNDNVHREINWNYLIIVILSEKVFFLFFLLFSSGRLVRNFCSLWAALSGAQCIMKRSFFFTSGASSGFSISFPCKVNSTTTKADNLTMSEKKGHCLYTISGFIQKIDNSSSKSSSKYFSLLRQTKPVCIRVRVTMSSR